eukprot:sb/3462385/
MQLQNKGLSDQFGEPYCMAQGEFKKDAYIYMVPCKGNPFFQFLIREEYGGSVFQLISNTNRHYCVDTRTHRVVTWDSRYHSAAELDTCDSVTTASTAQWVNFYKHSNYRGSGLAPVTDPVLKDGNWGQFKFMATGSCWGVDSTTLRVEQRYCLESDMSQKFRYDPRTKEIQNWEFPRLGGGKGCVNLQTGNKFYIGRCTGSILQKFEIREGSLYSGTFTQLIRHDDHRYCVDVWRRAPGHQQIYSYTCRKEIRDGDGQWIMFEFFKSSKVCPAGQIANGDNCVNCPANTYNPSRGATKCISCPSGTTSTPGSSGCLSINSCSAGSYMNLSNGRCYLCPKDTYAPTPGIVNNCMKCKKGYHTPGEGATSCTKTVKCQPGTFVNGNTCKACPINTYTNEANAPSCTACPSGWYTQTTGSTSCLKRSFCGPGTFYNGVACKKCPKNTFDNTVGNTKCQPCAPGFETKSTGATHCTRKNNCQAGSHWSEPHHECRKCPKDTFTAKPHQVRCSPCPKGTGTRGTGSTKCEKINYCKAGKYHNGEQCVNCPVNTFTNKQGAWKCTPCPKGTKTDKWGSTSCRKIVANDCTPGMFYNGKMCYKCQKNTFTDVKGLSYCKKCPSGWETKTIGASKCVKKQEIKVWARAEKKYPTCFSYKTSPKCLLKCRFKTNTGIKIANKTRVSFSKLVGSKWVKLSSPVSYNTKWDWFAVVVANRPTPSNAGKYRCQALYGGVTGSTDMELAMLQKTAGEVVEE